MELSDVSFLIFLVAVSMLFMAIIIIRLILIDPFEDKYQNFPAVAIGVILFIAALFLAYVSIKLVK